MVVVKILFFGAAADAVGSREIELIVGESAAAGSTLTQLLKDHPALANHKLFIAVNEQYADADTVLKAGDEIAVFTAVSGG